MKDISEKQYDEEAAFIHTIEIEPVWYDALGYSKEPIVCEGQLEDKK